MGEPESMCGGLQHFSVSPRPLGFGTKGFGDKGLGIRVWGQGQGLTIMRAILLVHLFICK